MAVPRLPVLLSTAAMWFACAAGAPAAQLQGPMERYHALAGSWNCASTITLPRGGTQHVTMIMAFDVVAGNALHDHLSADGFDAHLYYGYDPAKRTFWAITANNDGTQLQQTSSDGLFYSGAVAQHPNVRITDQFAFQSDDRFTIHDLTTVKQGTIVTDSTCTRATGT